jgi:3-hydroxyisobutyrate dehydrogenase
VPAEQGALLALLAGETSTLEMVRPVLQPMCREILDCGPVPNGTLTKLATNIVLLSQVASLAEAANMAHKAGVGAEALVRAILAGPLASDVMRVKGAKLLAGDFTAQAAIVNVVQSGQHARDAASREGVATPMLDAALGLYRWAEATGAGELDMIAVVKAFDTLGPAKP